MRNILALLFVAGLTGCSMPASSPKAALPTAPATPVATPSAAAADKRVTTDANLDVLKVTAGESSPGILRLEVEVQNPADKPRSFNYHLYWFTNDGTLIDLPDMTSVPLFLLGHEKSSIVAISPTPLARDFRMKFFATE